jgi:DNA polymerase-1
MGPKYETPMADVPLETLSIYACEDADIVFRLNERYTELLRECGLTSVYEKIEIPLVPVLASMEQAGVYIDADALSEISMKLDKRAKELEQVVYAEAGETFNINSPKQLQVILFEKLCIRNWD